MQVRLKAINYYCCRQKGGGTEIYMKRIITVESVEKFRRYLYEKEKSTNTIEKYVRDVFKLMKFVGEQAIEKKDLLLYKKEICAAYAPKSVNSMISSINAFFTMQGWNELKIKTLKIQRRIFAAQDRELTRAEYERLIAAAKRRSDKRIYYLMQTMGSTGIRISELRYVSVEAVKNGYANIDCKGKLRQVFLPQRLCKMLKEYIKRHNIKKGPVFVSKNGKPLDRSNIWRMLRGLCDEARVSPKKVFPHNFRHLFARTYYSFQKDIVRLADILGHSNINTTRIYTMESGETYKKQIECLGLLC